MGFNPCRCRYCVVLVNYEMEMGDRSVHSTFVSCHVVLPSGIHSISIRSILECNRLLLYNKICNELEMQRKKYPGFVESANAVIPKLLTWSTNAGLILQIPDPGNMESLDELIQQIAGEDIVQLVLPSCPILKLQCACRRASAPVAGQIGALYQGSGGGGLVIVL